MQNDKFLLFNCLKKGYEWNLTTGYEVSEMCFLSAAWGIGGSAFINGKIIEREGEPERKSPFFVLGDALKASAPEIAAAFEADWDLDLTKRLDKIHRGELVVIRTGWTKHAIILVLYRGYLAICNRGEGGPTQVCKVDLSKITAELLNSISGITSEERGPAMDFFYKQLPELLAATYYDPICYALNRGQRHLKTQKFGFCA